MPKERGASLVRMIIKNHYVESKEYKSNHKSKKEAEAFAQSQKVLSKDLEEQENQ